ncbi:MAG: hypothetical protein UAS51_00400 [Buchnera aphidicola (Floraphis meitanensis)]
MNVFKRLLISIILFCLSFLCSLIFLIHSHIGFNFIYFLVHHYIPELEIKESIGKLNNFVLKDVKYHSYNKSFFIKELHVRMHFNFYKRFYIVIDKFLFKKCNIRINYPILDKFQYKKRLLNLNLTYFFKIPIIFKNVKFDNFSCFIGNIMFIVDHFSGKYYWTGKILKCFRNKAHNIYLKKINYMNNDKNIYKNFKKNKIVDFKESIKEFLDSFRKFIIGVSTNVDIKHFSSDNIYFLGKNNFKLSQFFLNFKMISNIIHIKILFHYNANFKVNIYGTIDCNKEFFTKIIVNCIYFKSYTLNENVKIIITGFLLQNLNIYFKCNGVINTNMYVNIVYKKAHSTINLKLFISYFILSESDQYHLILKNVTFQIIGNMHNYSFFVDGIININKFIPIKLNFSGVGNYSIISINQIQCKLTDKKIIFDYLFNVFEYKKHSTLIKLTQNSKNQHYAKDIVQYVLYNFFNFKKSYNVSLDMQLLSRNNFVKRNNSKSGLVFSQIYNKWIVSIISRIFIKKDIFIKKNCNKIYGFSIVFKFNQLNNRFLNYVGNIIGNIKFYSVGSHYRILIKFLGNNLQSRFFIIDKLNCLIVLKNDNSNSIKVMLSAKNFFILNSRVSHFFLEFNTFKYNHNFYLSISKKSCLVNLSIQGKFNSFSKIWIETINNFNISTSILDVNINKVLIKFRNKKVINNFNVLYITGNFILNKNKKNINYIFSKFRYLYNISNKLSLSKIKLNFNYYVSNKKRILKWNCIINQDRDINRIFIGHMNIRKVNKRVFISGNFVFKNVSISLLNFLILNGEKVSGILNGVLYFDENTYTLKLFGNLLIQNFFINDYFFFKKVYFNHIKLFINHDNMIFNSYIEINAFLKFSFKLNYLNVCLLSNKINSFLITRVCHILSCNIIRN